MKKAFPSQLESVHGIQEFVNQNLEKIELDSEKLMQIDLVIEEVVVNIVKYGFPGKKQGQISIEISQPENQIIIKIIDNGIPFNPLEAETPDITGGLENRDPGGLGIFLVKQLTSKIGYSRKNQENHLSLHISL